jgi:flavin reductase (DIM6/NTAB) family NADH-FMN oxidoreductase RutF
VETPTVAKPEGATVKKSLGPETLLYPTPVLVVGSYDAEGRANAMTAAWGGVACSRPPCLCISLRAATASHGNILARKAFTISLPSRKQAAAADYFGIVSGRKVDKFAATGLTATAAEFVDAPYVAELPLNIECELIEVHELGLHTQFIGLVKDVKIDESCLDAKGRLDVRKLDPIAFGMPSSYFALGELLGPAYSIGRVYVAAADD